MKKTNMRIGSLVAACLFAGVALGGCGSSDTKQAAPAKQEQQASAVAASGLKTAEFEQPMLITSIGQSADAQMVKALAERSALKYMYEVAAKPDALDNAKTLVLVIGGSSKGMGAAGVNSAQEEERAKALIAKAKEKNIKIIAMHVGGASRRGDLTDRFIPLMADANYTILVADGDKDKAFTNIVASKMPVDYPANIGDVGKYLKAAFK
ncbi:MAG: hypothetical protein H6Q68_563 [Firmicutes bacterium]|nr:hypothetical protein [Bacillota bacterium]